ncbi:MAG: LPS-assembly protein LptD, partial [Bryobacteraceae bacterium]
MLYGQAPAPPRASPRLPHNEMVINAQHKDIAGNEYKLRGTASVETSDTLLAADEIDYNDETKQAQARGNVRLTNLAGGEKLECERADYNLAKKTGVCHMARGSSPARLDPRPGLLTTDNPFIFQGERAERNGDRYTVYNGFITSCRLPAPWWVLRGPVFEVIPGERAIARNTAFRLKGVPLFYTPYFYKSLAEEPRKSGFLTPNIGNSSRRGKMLGAGYFWAINRSYDVTYKPQYFSQRGFAHNLDMRGKPRQGAEFNALFYAVNDKGALQPDGSRIKQGG